MPFVVARDRAKRRVKLGGMGMSGMGVMWFDETRGVELSGFANAPEENAPSEESIRRFVSWALGGAEPKMSKNIWSEEERQEWMAVNIEIQMLEMGSVLGSQFGLDDKRISALKEKLKQRSAERFDLLKKFVEAKL